MTPNKRLELLNKLTHCGGGDIPLSDDESRYKAPPVLFDGEFYRISRGQESNWMNWAVDKNGFPLVNHRYRDVDRRILQLALDWEIVSETETVESLEKQGYSRVDRNFILSTPVRGKTRWGRR